MEDNNHNNNINVDDMPTTTAMMTFPPKRPRTAYNYFFRDERQRLIDTLPPRFASNAATGITNNRTSGSPTTARRRRHGKLAFAELGKTVGEKWRMVRPETLDYYAELANRDKLRYVREKEAYKAYLVRGHQQQQLERKQQELQQQQSHAHEEQNSGTKKETSDVSLTSRTEIVTTPWERSIAIVAQQLDKDAIDFLITAFK